MSEEVLILLVDDEPDILEFMSYNLKKEGYSVLTATSGEKALSVVEGHTPALIILDVMMPGMDGVTTCRELRKNHDLDQTVITFLSARGEEYSQIAGLEAGADDYIAKPIRPALLVSKVKALLRRASGHAQDNGIIEAGGISIDINRHLVNVNGTDCELPRKEFSLLCLLASSPGRVFIRDEILSKVWGSDVVVGDRTIDVHIRKLRERIGNDRIKTIKGVGYKFNT